MLKKLKLFSADDKYTELGMQLDKEFGELIQPAFNKYVDKGASPRDLATIINSLVFEIVGVAVLCKKLKKSKDKPTV